MRRTGVQVTELDMWRRVRPFRDAAAVMGLRRLLRVSRPDLLHLHSSKAGAIGRLAAAFSGTGPVVYTPHAYAFLDVAAGWRRAFYLAAERVLARLADMVVAVSESEREATLRHGLQPASRVTVVPNGLDEQTLRALERGETHHAGESAGVLRLGALGRLERQKAPLRLLDLATALRRRGVRFGLAVAGEGSLASACRTEARQRGIDGVVRFLGHVDDVRAFYRDIDVFVTTASFEGMPYSILDAMAAAVPVVGFDVPGVRDLVTSGETGYLSPAFDIERMVDSVSDLAARADLGRSMGLAGRQRVRASFRLDRQVDALVELYESAATSRHSMT